jgi:hypothetical protein
MSGFISKRFGKWLSQSPNNVNWLLFGMFVAWGVFGWLIQR